MLSAQARVVYHFGVAALKTCLIQVLRERPFVFALFSNESRSRWLNLRVTTPLRSPAGNFGLPTLRLLSFTP